MTGAVTAWRLIVLHAALLMLLATSTMGAGAFAKVPSAADPSRQDKRLEKSVSPKSTHDSPVLVPPPENVSPQDAEKVSFIVREIVIQAEDLDTAENLDPPGQADPAGSRASDLRTEFAPVIAAYFERRGFAGGTFTGKEILLSDIFAIADAITAHYRNDGFFLSQAYVPPQTIADGRVFIRVVEGYIDRVTIVTDPKATARDVDDGIAVQGKLGWRENLFQDYAWKLKFRQDTERIRRVQPLHIDDLERYTLLANDLPGVTAKSQLSPSKQKTGASDLKLILTHKPFDASISLDNRGTKTAGPREMVVTVTANNLLGGYERTTFTYVQTEQYKELRYIALSHDEILTSEGTTLTLSGNRSWSEPGASLAYLDMQSKSTSLEAKLSHPFIRRRQTNLSGHVRFTFKNTLSRSLGAKSSEDRVRAVRAGATFDYADRWNGINLIGAELHQGVNVFNATEPGSDDLTRSLGRSDFTKVTLDVSRNQRLPYGFGLTVAGTGQWSAHELLSAEEFGYGGSDYGRAYDSSEITGDHGWAARAELQYLTTPKIPHAKYHPYVFYDFGAVYNITPVDEPNKETGASAGIGIRFSVWDHVSGYLEVAKPLTRKVDAMGDDGDEPRIFFRLAASY